MASKGAVAILAGYFNQDEAELAQGVCEITGDTWSGK